MIGDSFHSMPALPYQKFLVENNFLPKKLLDELLKNVHLKKLIEKLKKIVIWQKATTLHIFS